jgi:hypothetical protein
MKRKIFILILSMMAALYGDLAAAAPIHSYKELVSAMCAGNQFVVVADFQRCTEKKEMPIGYFIPSSMMLVPANDTTPERVLTSDLHFSKHSSGPIYEYVKYTFNSDDSVLIQTTFYDPKNFNPIGTMHTIKCTLGEGIEIFSRD